MSSESGGFFGSDSADVGSKEHFDSCFCDHDQKLIHECAKCNNPCNCEDNPCSCSCGEDEILNT